MVSRQDFEHALIIMHDEGWSIHALCRYFHASRNAVRRILRTHENQRDSGHDMLKKMLKRASKLDVFEPEIKRLIEKYPDITGVRVHEELQGSGLYRGDHHTPREACRAEALQGAGNPVRNGAWGSGPDGLEPLHDPLHRTGKSTVQCFSYILGFSRRQYIDFTTRRDFYSLIRRHEDAFRYYQGVPRECLYDNEKTIVLRWEAGKPVFNPAFMSFITHYNCKPIACRPGQPETKGKIEAHFYT